MSKRRIDTPDTLDPVLHFISKWQSEQWGLESMETQVEYGAVAKKAPALPIAVTLTVRMVPR